MKDNGAYASRRFLDEHDKKDDRTILTSILHHNGYSSINIVLTSDSIGWAIKDKEDVSKALRCIGAMEEELSKLRKEVSCMKPDNEDSSSKE